MRENDNRKSLGYSYIILFLFIGLLLFGILFLLLWYNNYKKKEKTRINNQIIDDNINKRFENLDEFRNNN